MLTLDGSFGEGGGQILRSSLALSMMTRQKLRLVNIRAGRSKPGLLRQHLACVHAARQVCNAEVTGAELGSREVTFAPGPIRTGTYDFPIGSAGSTSLVLQTVLPALLLGAEPSTIRLQGGTHNPAAPTYDFLSEIYFPILRAMGASIDAELRTVGFYPAGGGEVVVRLQGPVSRPIELGKLTGAEPITAWILSNQVPAHVGLRELAVVAKVLDVCVDPPDLRRAESPGPGNVVCLRIGQWELISAFGERGRPAERVAAEAVDQAQAYLAAGAAVGEHLADQLLLPMAWTGGSFRTGELSTHATTNIDVVRRFLGESSVRVDHDSSHVVVTCPGCAQPS